MTVNRYFFTFLPNYVTLLLAGLWCLLLAACLGEEVALPGGETPGATTLPVSFNSFVGEVKSGTQSGATGGTRSGRGMTRATYPEGVATGVTDLDGLKASGFGVMAVYTGTADYSASTGSTFNFMWNQQVTWDDALGDDYVTRWTYSPVKYWPNDHAPADDQDNDSGNNPATGSGADGDKVSFLGYAPYVAATTPAEGFDVKDDDGDDADSEPDHDGIVKLTANTSTVSEASLYYRTSLTAPFDAEQSVDLLWAVPQLDRTKMDGAGYTGGTVDMVFRHALSLFTISVQGLFDHVDNADATTTYPDDREMYTKILVDTVEIKESPLFTEGTMYLAPDPVNATVPKWAVAEDKTADIKLEGEEINPTIWNRYLDGTYQKYWDEADAGVTSPANLKSLLQLSDQNHDGVENEADALALFNQLPKGVSHTEVALNNTEYDAVADAYKYKYYMVVPNKEYREAHPTTSAVKVRMVYYVITYDPRLTLVKTGYPKYFSIVKNDVTATFSNFSFEANKKYKLRLQPGLTSAKFDVTVVDNWDTPLTLDPEVVDWYTTVMEYDVE